MQCQQGESQPQTPGPSCSLPAPLISACSFLCNRTQAPGVSWQPLLPASFSVTHPLQGKSKTSAHTRRGTERSISWERGWRQMLLACLIAAARPWVSASWLAVGNGTCFPSRCAAVLAHRQWETRRVELCSRVKPRCIHTPGTRCRSGVPAYASITHPGADTRSPSAPSRCVPRLKPPSLCRAGARWSHRLSPALPNPEQLAELLKPFPKCPGPLWCLNCSCKGGVLTHGDVLAASSSPLPAIPPSPPMPPMAGGGPLGLSLPSQGLPTCILPWHAVLTHLSPIFPQKVKFIQISLQFKPQNKQIDMDCCFASPRLSERPLGKPFILNRRKRASFPSFLQ